MFDYFENIHKRNDEWRDDAQRKFLPGIDPADLKPGAKVTISPNLMVHDRSYTNELLTVVAVNTQNVQLSRKHGGNVILALHEHHFYAADDFADEQAA